MCSVVGVVNDQISGCGPWTDDGVAPCYGGTAVEKQVYMEGEALSFGQRIGTSGGYLGREQAGGVQRRNLHRNGMKPSMDGVTQG